MNKHLTILTIFFFGLTIGLQAQTQHKNLREGDSFYQDSLYTLAEEGYRRAENESTTFKGSYNLGNALYQQGRFEEAAEQFNRALGAASANSDKALTLHNLGNAYFQSQKIEEAINYYKRAVSLNPDNQETKYNLMVAKEILKNAQPPEQEQQQQKQEGEEGEESDENQENQEQQDQDQENKEQKDQEQKEKDQEQKDQEDKEKEEEEKESKDQQDGEGAEMDSSRLEKQTLDSLDAQKLLQIIQDEEAKVQEKLRKFNTDRRKSDKDW